ncbi:cation transporter [Dietzia sp. HMSC21D01]|uniref:DMT family transporter n=1 Tax=Dietzia TaxID=37914 RepID=UPI0008A474D4|nr:MULTISPECIES: multidrug efflux SMR transporter [Dietzia]MCT2107436.1 multidrug efflux SMR transporter [Dietzia cinnamea]OFS14644.1 cation transporter [Dietzia sp. HMSC21D01]
MSWLWLGLSILFEVIGTLSLRASDGFRKRLWLVPVVVGYVVAFSFLGLALSAGMPVGVAYGIWTSVGIILVAVCARSLWNDPLTKRMLLGMGIIIAGVLLVEFGGTH